MNRNFSLKFKVVDIIIIVASAIAAISLMVGIFIYNSSFSGERYVCIYYKGEELKEYRTEIDKLEETYTVVLTKEKYPDLLGDFYIDINKDKGIRVHDVTCPNLTCEKQGWVNITNLPIVCIPNDIRVVINSTDSSEGNETLGFGGVRYYGKDF
ncbi:MAG: NusG domain II-containing protein [Bacilli bacterium]